MDSSFAGYQSSLFRHRETKHKKKPTQFTSVAGGTKTRLEKNLRYRKSCRLSVFDNVRNLDNEPSRSNSPAPRSETQLKLERRRQQLEKWKEEKEKQKKEQASQKKKPFLTGVPHAPLNKCIPPPIKEKPSTLGRVTRSQASSKQMKQKIEEKPATKSFAPRNATFRPPTFNNFSIVPTLVTITNAQKNTKAKNEIITFKPVVPITKTDMPKSNSKSNPYTKLIKDTASTRSARLIARNARNNKTTELNTVVTGKVVKSPKKLKKTPKKVIQSSSTSASSSSFDVEPKKSTNSSTSRTVNKSVESPILPSKTQKPSQVTPKTVVPRSESSSEQKLRSPKELMLMSTQQFVDEVTKVSPSVTLSRGKDKARKEMKKKLDEGLLDKDNCDEDSVQHFRRQLASEVARMTAMCDNWDEIYENTTLPEFVQEMVLGAVGMARLLMSSKLQQFAGLVERCEAREAAGAGAARVMPTDLHGFWDMLFIQIENVDMRFKKLEELRARDWAEEAPAPATAQRRPSQRRPAQPRPQTRPATRPGRQKPAAGPPSRIREMIAAARRAQQNSSPSVPSPPSEKSFEAGFFSVRSPVRSPAPATPRQPRASLLKCVLSSEANKASATQNSASFAMLRASMLCKNIDIEGISPLEQTPKLPAINLNATPARSILKITHPANSAKKTAKKTVLFNDSDTEEANDANKNKAKDAELNTDSGLSSMDIDKDNDKENKSYSRRKSKLTRQEAVEDNSPVKTTSRRKSIQTPKLDDEKTPRRSSRKSVLQEPGTNPETKVERRKKCGAEEVAKATPRRSNRRNKVVEDLIDFQTPPVYDTRKRGKKSAGDI